MEAISKLTLTFKYLHISVCALSVQGAIVISGDGLNIPSRA